MRFAPRNIQPKVSNATNVGMTMTSGAIDGADRSLRVETPPAQPAKKDNGASTAPAPVVPLPRDRNTGQCRHVWMGFHAPGLLTCGRTGCSMVPTLSQEGRRQLSHRRALCRSIHVRMQPLPSIAGRPRLGRSLASLDRLPVGGCARPRAPFLDHTHERNCPLCRSRTQHRPQ